MMAKRDFSTQTGGFIAVHAQSEWIPNGFNEGSRPQREISAMRITLQRN